jgi:hypothetical protein
MKSYLGIDPGWSATKKTTGLCRIEIRNGANELKFDSVGNDPLSRVHALSSLVIDGVSGIGIDGPITNGFELTKRLRPVDSMLSKGKFQSRGKAGAINGGAGPKLHAEATWWAIEAASLAIGTAPDWAPSEKLVVESFPSAFLSVMHPDAKFPINGRPWSTTLLARPPVRRALDSLVNDVLGGGEIHWDTIDNCSPHEADAFLCALSAALVDAGDFIAVGDHILGFMVLPPVSLFGGNEFGDPWALNEISTNLSAVRSDPRFRDLSPLIIHGQN